MGLQRVFIGRVVSEYHCKLLVFLDQLELTVEERSLMMKHLPKGVVKIDDPGLLYLTIHKWGGFLHDPHLTAALLDRITVNCAVFNMKDCISIRPKNIVYATNKQASSESSGSADGQ